MSERLTSSLISIKVQPKVAPLLIVIMHLPLSPVAAVFAIFFGIYKDRKYKMLEATVSTYYTEYHVASIVRGEMDSVAIVHLYTMFEQMIILICR